jgi:hypothetical protein
MNSGLTRVGGFIELSVLPTDIQESYGVTMARGENGYSMCPPLPDRLPVLPAINPAPFKNNYLPDTGTGSHRMTLKPEVSWNKWSILDFIQILLLPTQMHPFLRCRARIRYQSHHSSSICYASSPFLVQCDFSSFWNSPMWKGKDRTHWRCCAYHRLGSWSILCIRGCGSLFSALVSFSIYCRHIVVKSLR